MEVEDVERDTRGEFFGGEWKFRYGGTPYVSVWVRELVVNYHNTSLCRFVTLVVLYNTNSFLYNTPYRPPIGSI